MTEDARDILGSVRAGGAQLPVRTLFQLALAALKTRLARSIVTLSAVVLAIAYLSYSGVNNAVIYELARVEEEDIIASLRAESGMDQADIKKLAARRKEEVLMLLRQAKVNIEATRAGNPLDQWLVLMALLTCTVGIANAMLMSVTERFREIGTMKCLGAEDGTVVKLFLIESLLMGGVGSLAGIVVGLLISAAVGLAQFGWYAVEYLPFGSVLRTCGLSLLAGLVLCLIGAGYPSLLAARMRPVEALRVEE